MLSWHLWLLWNLKEIQNRKNLKCQEDYPEFLPVSSTSIGLLCFLPYNSFYRLFPLFQRKHGNDLKPFLCTLFPCLVVLMLSSCLLEKVSPHWKYKGYYCKIFRIVANHKLTLVKTIQTILLLAVPSIFYAINMLSVLHWNLKFCFVLSIKGSISRTDWFLSIFIFMRIYLLAQYDRHSYSVFCVVLKGIEWVDISGSL